MMNNSVTLREQSHWYLKAGTYISAALSLVFFIIFWSLTNPFWVSIFRLAAFCFFALTIVGYLNIMNGPLKIIGAIKDDKIIVSYYKKGKMVHDEEFDASTIEEFFVTQSQQNIIQQLFLPHSATLKVTFSDSENDLFVFEFGGRPLYLEETMLQKAMAFLEDHDFAVIS